MELVREGDGQGAHVEYETSFDLWVLHGVGQGIGGDSMDSGRSSGGAIEAGGPESIAEEMVCEGAGEAVELTVDQETRQGDLGPTGVVHVSDGDLRDGGGGGGGGDEQAGVPVTQSHCVPATEWAKMSREQRKYYHKRQRSKNDEAK
jgi:hypothetical protein